MKPDDPFGDGPLFDASGIDDKWTGEDITKLAGTIATVRAAVDTLGARLATAEQLARADDALKRRLDLQQADVERLATQLRRTQWLIVVVALALLLLD